ncbi:hypothetical protein FS837_002647, partial [Tulasnella sp. UAMH 9824]
MSFDPSLRAVIINALFTLSLSSSLFASFFAVLGKQWLMLYRNTKGGGVDQQRWEQLRRSLGAERWGLVPVLEVALPIFIQAALIISAVGFVSLLGTRSKILANFVLVPLVVASFLWVLTAGISLWDVSCPFRHPLSEIALRVPLFFSAIARAFRRQKQARAKARLGQTMKKRLERLGRGSGVERDEVMMDREDDKEMESGFPVAKDVETGQAEFSVMVQGGQSPPIPGTANQPRRGPRERWRSLINKVISKRRGAMKRSKTGFENLMASLRNLKARLRELMVIGWDLFWGFQIARTTEPERVLQVESIKRVINISEDPKALYHAALNLRPITNSELLQLVYDDEITTRGLRECYLEALEDLEKKHSRDKPNPKLLRETLTFGTAFIHVSLSATSFDDFMTTIGVKRVDLPLDSEEISDAEAQEAGMNCREACKFLRKFIWLQMRGLGPQPTALMSTTLAAVAFWYAINGIPHSQEVVYGSKFREALVSSEISWASVNLLALITQIACPFNDPDGRKAYRAGELDWCRYAFFRVKDAYSLSGPTQELADAVRISLSTGKNLETNAILFRFAWRLFTRDDEGDSFVKLGEHALFTGYHLICALEGAIRSLKTISCQEATSSPKASSARKAAERYEKAREMCFTAMIECMGPRDGKIELLRRRAWRQRITIKTATTYMNYISNLKGKSNDDDNAFAMRVMDQIRKAL